MSIVKPATEPPTAPVPEAKDAFQPGQLGMRHLLGAMTVAATILGISTARLRSLRPLEAAFVAGHWAIVLSVAGTTFFFTSRRRRRDRAAAGQIWLRVLCRPMSDGRRRFIRWLLTALVVIDGVFMSLVPYPGLEPPQFGKGLTTLDIWASILRGAMPQIAIWEGALWGWCLSHWLANVYWVEFCEHGVLTYAGYFPWKKITRIGWSPTHRNNLVFFHGGHYRELAIDPASHAAVSKLLEKVRSKAEDGGPALAGASLFHPTG